MPSDSVAVHCPPRQIDNARDLASMTGDMGELDAFRPLRCPRIAPILGKSCPQAVTRIRDIIRRGRLGELLACLNGECLGALGNSFWEACIAIEFRECVRGCCAKCISNVPASLNAIWPEAGVQRQAVTAVTNGPPLCSAIAICQCSWEIIWRFEPNIRHRADGGRSGDGEGAHCKEGLAYGLRS
jgi:hypothetical protein